MGNVVLGLDVGGANLKAATADGRSSAVPFALWKQPAGLTAALQSLIAQFEPIGDIAATMTGELCDCFATKAEGVTHIVRAIQLAAAGKPVRVWSLDGEFVAPERAIEWPMAVAASNWHALATWIGMKFPNDALLLVDVGSTTADVIPLSHGRILAAGRTDSERLEHGELVYIGMKRTPLCALLPSGRHCAEWFATTHDAYVLVGWLPEEPSLMETADGRAMTIPLARARVARMIGGDDSTVSLEEAKHLAVEAIGLMKLLLLDAAGRQLAKWPVGERPVLLASGLGERLVRESLQGIDWADVRSLGEILGSGLSEVAPAFAVANLATKSSAPIASGG